MPGQQALLNFLQQPSPAQLARQQHQVLLANQRAVLQKNRLAAGAQAQQNQQLLGNQRAILARNKGVLAQQKQAQQNQIAQGNLGLRAIQEQRLQRGQQVSTAQAAGGAIAGVGERLGGIGDRFETWADGVPKPGGILLLLAVIFFFIWAVVPVNGKHTRMELLWLTFTGRTTMAAAAEGGTGSGGLGEGDYSSNGHVEDNTAMSLLNQLPIRDFGGIP